jgi:hypothetical protein
MSRTRSLWTAKKKAQRAKNGVALLRFWKKWAYFNFSGYKKRI